MNKKTVREKKAADKTPVGTGASNFLAGKPDRIKPLLKAHNVDGYDYEYQLEDINALTLDGSDVTVPRGVIREVRDMLLGTLLVPGSADYETVRKCWNGAWNRRPGLIIRVHGQMDTEIAVNFAREYNLLTTIRGGGHSMMGESVSDGGLMIDCSLLRSCRVDPYTKTANLGSGGLLGDLYAETQHYGLIVPAGMVSDTGAAGLTLMGGNGRLTRMFGMACDNVKSFDIVTADGKFRKASAEENSDLYWALRGGGGNFGVVTNFEYYCNPLDPTVLEGSIVWPYKNKRFAKQLCKIYRDIQAEMPDEMSPYLIISTMPDTGQKVLNLNLLYAGAPDEGEKLIAGYSALQEFIKKHPPMMNDIGPRPYLLTQNKNDGFAPHGTLVFAKLVYSNKFASATMDDMLDQFEDAPPNCHWVLEGFGREMVRKGEDFNAYAQRVEHVYEAAGIATTLDHYHECREWVLRAIGAMVPHSTSEKKEPKFAFNNSHEDVESFEPDDFGRFIYRGNYERLVDIKTKYDPDNMFRYNDNIKPRPAE